MTMTFKKYIRAWIHAATILLALWNCGTLFAQSDRDLFYVRGEARPVAGKVTAITPDTISVQSSQGAEEIPVDKIVNMVLAEDPPGLRSVRSNIESGRLEDAANALRGLEAVGGSELLKQDVAFLQAFVQAKLALNGSGNVNQAVLEMREFAKNYPQSFHYYESQEVLGDLAAMLGRFDIAAQFYAKLGNAESEAIRSQGLLLQADSLLRQQQVQAALPIFEQARRSSDDRIAARGAIGVARCNAEMGKAEQGIEILESVIAEHPSNDTDLFARAYNALGASYLALDKANEALLAYLHTDLLFYRHAEQHAEALYHLDGLWTKLNKPSEAAKCRQLLKQRYPSTSWAKK